MCLLYQAALSWCALLDTTYEIVIGHKQKSHVINLVFRMGDFDHLAGMQYAKDVDFKLPKAKYAGERLIPAILSGALDASLIEKGKDWRNTICLRLQGIVQMQEILESDFVIYQFNPQKLNFYSKIGARYLIYSPQLERGFFLFLDETDHIYYCKSIFADDTRDYRQNQTKWIVLKKTRIVNQIPEVLYLNSCYHT